MVTTRLYPYLKFIRVRKCYMVVKSQSLSWVVRNYMKDVSICEQRMFSLYQNHLIFFWEAYEPKTSCHTNL